MQLGPDASPPSTSSITVEVLCSKVLPELIKLNTNREG